MLDFGVGPFYIGSVEHGSFLGRNFELRSRDHSLCKAAAVWIAGQNRLKTTPVCTTQSLVIASLTDSAFINAVVQRRGKKRPQCFRVRRAIVVLVDAIEGRAGRIGIRVF